MSKPDIQAEMMASLTEPGGPLQFLGFRFEVFDLPALEGTDSQCELAGEIMAVATSDAGDAFHKLAWQRVPDGFPTQTQLDELNADLARMANDLANAVAKLTDATWWIDHQNEIDIASAFNLILGAAGRTEESCRPRPDERWQH